MMCAPPLVAADIEGLAYRELQRLCKSHGLGAKGKADELRAKLLEAASSASVASQHVDGMQASMPPAAESAEAPAPAVATKGETEENFNDSLFDDLLAELDEPFGAFNPLGAETPVSGGAGPVGAADSAGESADPLGPLDDDGMSAALAALADLDLELDRQEGEAGGVSADLLAPPDDGSSFSGGGTGGGDAATSGGSVAAAGGEEEGNELFDESWLDDLFGPIGEAGGAAPGPASTSSFRPLPRGGGGGQQSWYGQDGYRRPREIDVPDYEESSADPNGGLRRAILLSAREVNDRRCLGKLSNWRKKGLPVEQGIYSAGLRSWCVSLAFSPAV